jgi:hypothetical protein
MSGPGKPHDDRAQPRPDNNGKSPPPRPPGDFLTDDLASDTARFLEAVKQRIHRAAEADRPPRA